MREYLTIQHLLHLKDMDWRFVPENYKNDESDSEEELKIQEKTTSWISSNHDKFADLLKNRRNPKALKEMNVEDFNASYNKVEDKFRDCPESNHYKKTKVNLKEINEQVINRLYKKDMINRKIKQIFYNEWQESREKCSTSWFE